jgi:hypothetical protein
MKILTAPYDIEGSQNVDHRPAEHKLLEGKSVVW